MFRVVDGSISKGLADRGCHRGRHGGWVKSLLKVVEKTGDLLNAQKRRSNCAFGELILWCSSYPLVN